MPQIYGEPIHLNDFSLNAPYEVVFTSATRELTVFVEQEPEVL